MNEKPNTFFTSDLHFGHDKDFIWKYRGYSSVQEMNEKQVEEWNKTVGKNDMVYVLGDVYLGESNIEFVSRLNGHLVIVAGNHDTGDRLLALEKLPNVSAIDHVVRPRFNGRDYWLCHYPTVMDMPRTATPRMICLFGHTHQTEPEFEDFPFMVNVGVDCWKRPVSLEEIERFVLTKWGEPRGNGEK